MPVGALEWRIREDVPTNLRAVKVASEKLPWECEQDPNVLEALAASRREQAARMTVAPREWMEDETLGAYIGEAAAGDPLVGGGSGGGGASSTKAFVRVGVGSTTGGPPGGNVSMRAVRGGAGGAGPEAGAGVAKAGSGGGASFLERFFSRRAEE